jgi:hypothetical protein
MKDLNKVREQKLSVEDLELWLGGLFRRQTSMDMEGAAAREDRSGCLREEVKGMEIFFGNYTITG